MATTTTTKYRTRGNVRGTCPHNHRTLSGAARCLTRDQQGCVSQGGYSDRRVEVLCEDGQWRRLNDDDQHTADVLQGLVG